MKNYKEWLEWVADEILQENDNLDDALTACCERADSCEDVIYFGKAHEFCRTRNIEQGEEFLEQCGVQPDDTYDSLACKIVYGQIVHDLRVEVENQYDEVC